MWMWPNDITMPHDDTSQSAHEWCNTINLFMVLFHGYIPLRYLGKRLIERRWGQCLINPFGHVANIMDQARRPIRLNPLYRRFHHHPSSRGKKKWWDSLDARAMKARLYLSKNQEMHMYSPFFSPLSFLSSLQLDVMWSAFKIRMAVGDA